MKSVQEVLDYLVKERKRMEGELVGIPTKIVEIQAQIAQCSVGDRTPYIEQKQEYLRRQVELPIKISYNSGLVERFNNGNGHCCVECEEDIEPERLGKYDTCARHPKKR